MGVGTGRWLLAITSVVAGGCGNVLPPGGPDESELRPSFEVEGGSQTIPPGVPEPYRSWPVYVNTVASPSISGGFAVGQSIVNFVGPAASSWVTLFTPFGSASDTTTRYLSFWDYSGGQVAARAELLIPSGQCTGVVTSEAGGAVWKHFAAWKWGRKENFDTKSEACPEPEPCTESGGGEATMRAYEPAVSRAGGRAAPERVARMRIPDRLDSTCGDETGPPGGGGGGEPPAGGAPPNCYWARDYVIYTDGTWDWLGPWEHVCEGDPMIRADSRATHDASRTASSVRTGPASGMLRVRLLGSGSLASGKSIEVHWYPALDVDAVIRIDTRTATAADLETAFSLAEHVSNRASSGHIGAIQGPASSNARMNSGPSSRAREFLNALLRASQRNTLLFGRARSLDITIERKGTSSAPRPGRSTES